VAVVGVIGLGHVGLPLVVEFGKLERTIAFDIVADKVARSPPPATGRGRPPRRRDGARSMPSTRPAARRRADRRGRRAGVRVRRL